MKKNFSKPIIAGIIITAVVLVIGSIVWITSNKKEKGIEQSKVIEDAKKKTENKEEIEENNNDNEQEINEETEEDSNKEKAQIHEQENDITENNNNTDHIVPNNNNNNNSVQEEAIIEEPQIKEENKNYIEEYRQRVLDLVNAERTKIGISTLELDNELCKAADIRAFEIISMFSHTRPNNSSCFTVLDEMRISYLMCAENIAEGYLTPEEVVNSWMNSEGHKANILNANYNKIGISCYNTKSGYKFYWVQLFIKR